MAEWKKLTVANDVRLLRVSEEIYELEVEIAARQRLLSELRIERVSLTPKKPVAHGMRHTEGLRDRVIEFLERHPRSTFTAGQLHAALGESSKAGMRSTLHREAKRSVALRRVELVSKGVFRAVVRDDPSGSNPSASR